MSEVRGTIENHKKQQLSGDEEPTAAAQVGRASGLACGCAAVSERLSVERTVLEARVRVFLFFFFFLSFFLFLPFFT